MLPPSLILFSQSLSHPAKVPRCLPQPCPRGRARLCSLTCLPRSVPDETNYTVCSRAGCTPRHRSGLDPGSCPTKTLPPWTPKPVGIRQPFLKISSPSISSCVLRTGTSRNAHHLTNIFISLAVRGKTLQDSSGLRGSSADAWRNGGIPGHEGTSGRSCYIHPPRWPRRCRAAWAGWALCPSLRVGCSNRHFPLSPCTSPGPVPLPNVQRGVLELPYEEQAVLKNAAAFFFFLFSPHFSW